MADNPMRRISRTKRAVSPLIATVLLIAFAVALGAVVMNWGKTQIQDQILTEEECRLVKFTWFQRNGIDHACIDGGTLTMTLQNGAQREINNLKLIVDGTKDIFIKQDLIDTPIGKAEPKRVNVEFNKETYGDPNSISLVPIISKGDRSLVCPVEHALTKIGIQPCEN